MTSALILAGGILACTLVAVFMVWDLRQQRIRDEWWAGVLRFRAENADLATGTLQLEYAVAIGHTLVRNEVVTADLLSRRLMETRGKPRAFEVVA